MDTYICEDEVLEINADFSDFISDDDQVNVTQNEIVINHKRNERIWIKFFRKGKVSLIDLRDDLLKMLISIYSLNIDGIFFVDDSSVLVEVELNDSARNYLLFIYEERLGNKVVKNKSIKNIVKLCDGKFSIIINNTVIFLVILPGTETIYMPCKSSSFPYGLSNGKIINLQSSCFVVDKRFSIYECLLTLQGELDNNLDCFVGIRLELDNESENTSRIRFSLKHEQLSNNFLIKLKKIFGMMSFSQTTIHLLPAFRENFTVNCNKQLVNFDSNLSSIDLIYPVAAEAPSTKESECKKMDCVNSSHSRKLGKKLKRNKRYSALYRQNYKVSSE